MLMCSTPFIDAFMPLVPLASSGLRGVLSQTSQPCTSRLRDVQVVVVDERDAAAEPRIERVAEDVLQMMLAGFVGRVRLAGEHELHGPARRR